MRNITLTLAALLLGAASVTAHETRRPTPQRIAPFVPNLVAKAAPQSVAPTGPRQAPRRTPITLQPEGTLYDNMVVSYGGYQRNWLYGLMDVSTDGGMGKVVEDAEGNVYIYNLPTGLNAETWVMAEKAEGDTVVIHRQHIDQREGSGKTYDYYITRVVWEYTDEETGEGRFVEAQGDTDMKLLYHDGILESCEENIDPFEEGHYALGAVYTTDNKTFTWEGATNWNLRYEVLTDTPLALPEGATTEKMTVSFISNGTEAADQIDVAFVGNDVYLNLAFPGVYIKGTIDGDKLRFPSGQYLGIYYNAYHLFFVAQRFSKVLDETTGNEVDIPTILDELVFDYDPATRSFRTDDALAINVGKSTTRLYLQTLRSPYFYFYQETAATPADPKITDYRATYGDYGYNALQFTIVATDTEGGYIVPEKLSWRAFIDDEPFAFTTDDYDGLTEDLDEVPYGFTDSNYDIYTSWYTFYFQPAKNVGIQSIYRGAGEERRSNIVYYDIKTSQIYTETDPETAIRATAAESPVTGTAYYDLTGRRVSPQAGGLLLESMHHADGTVTTRKVVRR